MGPIEEDPDQLGVVDRPFGQAGHPVGPEPRADRPLELGLGPAGNAGPARLEGIRRRLGAIEGLQRVDQTLVVLRQHDLVEPPVAGPIGQGRVAPAPVERLGRPIPDQLGKALVEGRGALHVERVVGDFVEDQRREFDRVADHGRAEERVVEPAERRIGGGRPEPDVVALGGQLVGLLPGHGRIEEALVRHPPHDGVFPGDRADAVLLRSGEREEQGVAPDVGIGGVGVLGLEAQGGGVAAHRQDQIDVASIDGRKRGVANQPFERLAPLEDPGLFDPGPGEVADVLAGHVGRAVPHEQRDGGDQDPHGDSLLSHGVQRTPKRWTPRPSGLRRW